MRFLEKCSNHRRATVQTHRRATALRVDGSAALVKTTRPHHKYQIQRPGTTSSELYRQNRGTETAGFFFIHCCSEHKRLHRTVVDFRILKREGWSYGVITEYRAWKHTCRRGSRCIRHICIYIYTLYIYTHLYIYIVYIYTHICGQCNTGMYLYIYTLYIYIHIFVGNATQVRMDSDC